MTPRSYVFELQQRENVSHLTDGPAGPLKRLSGSAGLGTRKIA
jgi:hypothetical protein